jgi:lysophospholipase L1-like esterase
MASVAVLGDSIVYGTGDSANDGRGGYVLRAAKLLPRVKFFNDGVPGLTARKLLKRVKSTLNKQSSVLKTTLLQADVIVVDVGRNDWWSFGPVSQTVAVVRRIQKSLVQSLDPQMAGVPRVVVAVPILPNRTGQGDWVRELGEQLLKVDSQQLPSNLRFDLVSKRLLSPTDGLHPTPRGYAALAKVLVSYLQKSIAPL